MFHSLVQPANQPTPEAAEDVFSSALSLISPGDVSVLHGDPGSSVTYVSERYGALELRLAEPQTEDARKLFGQYLWNAGVLLAELIGGAETATGRAKWVVNNERVLELGAGSGLAGIVSVLAGAEEVVISDYPALELLENIQVNVVRNIPTRLLGKVSVRGHEWGAIRNRFSDAHAHRFTRLLSADCLWMSGQHHNLVQSMLHFLSFDLDARVWVVAGFHTGRASVASFFQVAAEAGLEVEQCWERDVDRNDREWKEERDSATEDITALKKWLVVAILRRKALLPSIGP